MSALNFHLKLGCKQRFLLLLELLRGGHELLLGLVQLHLQLLGLLHQLLDLEHVTNLLYIHRKLGTN